MESTTRPLPVARLKWTHPETGEAESFDLHEGVELTIGRAPTNQISLPHQHVSRQHASIEYRDGMFILADLNSANGTFLNDQFVSSPMPLMAGDKIRLYTPELDFVAVLSDDTARYNIPVALVPTDDTPGGLVGTPRLIFLSGPQKDEIVKLTLDDLKLGRATLNHTWEIGIQDSSVSRPHARLARAESAWVVYDLGSANGTRVNSVNVTEKGKVLADGDVLTLGQTMIQFRTN